MTQALFELEPDEDSWRGPFESSLGFHLVLLVGKSEGRYPSLEEVAGDVRYDAEQAAVDALTDEALQAIVDTYEERRELLLEAPAATQ